MCALLVPALVVGPLTNTQASAADETTYVKVSNRATGNVIDGMGRTTDGANAGQSSSSDTANQQWELEPAGAYVRVKNRGTNLYLDGMGRTANGSICSQRIGSADYSQQWTQEAAGTYVKFRNRATGLYLDGAGRTDNGADLKMWASSTSNNQQWTVPGTVPPPTGTRVVLDGNNIRAANVNGLTFKGFGLLSANGTSELLMDYKAQSPSKYAELLQILFGGPNPVLTNVKVEMGNDRNNSTGPDPATMRLESEAPNVKRHQGFQLAADAKKVNPAIKVSMLRWNAPAWANTNDKIYTWYKKTMLEAYRSYGFMVDYVNPGLNERGADLNWTKRYASLIRTDSAGFADATERTLYNGIRVVISDEAGSGQLRRIDGQRRQPARRGCGRRLPLQPRRRQRGQLQAPGADVRQGSVEQRGAGHLRQLGLPAQQQHAGADRRGDRHRR